MPGTLCLSVPLVLMGLLLLPAFRSAPSRSIPLPNPDLAEVACQVSFRQGAVLYGQDAGVLSDNGGWLHFEGSSCSFDLNPKDVQAFLLEEHPLIGLVGEQCLEFDFSAKESVRPMPDGRALLRRWHAGTPPEGESVFPPNRLQPSWDPRRLRFRVWLGGTMLAGAVGMSLVAFQNGTPDFLGFAVISGVIGLLCIASFERDAGDIAKVLGRTDDTPLV